MGIEETATLAGGCFWCLEGVFTGLEGVISVESGYMGGTVENPTYQQVCTGTTGHAEVVQIRFDPSVTGFAELLEVFFSLHDPTTPDRQGNDVGTQYRSEIFYHSEEQHRQAAETIQALQEARKFRSAIVTRLSPAGVFYRAEQYHQSYFENNSHQPYCMFVVAPKVEKFRHQFAGKLKSQAR